MKADTHHIETCRTAWHAHWPTCPHCSKQKEFPDWCESGQVLFDEYRSAIQCHKDIESVEATICATPIPK